MGGPLAFTKLASLSYYRWEFDNWFSDLGTLRRECPLDHTASKRALSSRNAQANLSLGRLENLPVETIQQILQYLDLQTLFEFRAVNRRATLMIDNIPSYRVLIAYVPDVLRAMFRTHAVQHHSFINLYAAFESESCYLCGSFGAFFSLLECRRCCYYCLLKAEETLPHPRAQALKDFGLSETTIAKTPCMLSLPGSYHAGPGNRPKSVPGRVILISKIAAKEAGIILHGGEKAMDEYVHSEREKAKVADREGAAKKRCLGSSSPPHHLVDSKPPPILPCLPNYDHKSDAILHGAARRAYRFMAAVRLPQRNGQFDWGLSCKGCEDVWDFHRGKKDYGPNPDMRKDYERTFSREELLDHFHQCERSQELWEAQRLEASIT